jgi:Sulfotransferase domain
VAISGANVNKRDPMTRKVFGIGLSRTGTSTLVNAFRILGYKSIHFPMTVKQFHDYEAAADISVSVQYKNLDRAFPGSRFIYTTRNMDSWLQSCEALWARKRNVANLPAFITDTRRALYDAVDFDAEKFAAGYRRHDAAVRDYFANRPDDFLEFDICGGQADWPTLCQFLDKDIPRLPFPWSNNGDKVDLFLIRALHVLGGVEKTAKILHAERSHLQHLTQSKAYADHDATDMIAIDDGAQISFLVAQLLEQTGGMTQLTDRFSLEPQSVKKSLLQLKSRMEEGK